MAREAGRAVVARTYRVKLTMEAQSDLKRIHEYIQVEASLQVADDVFDRIIDVTLSLKFLPMRHEQVGFSRSEGSPVYTTFCGPFIICYRVVEADSAVYVFSIRHGRQQRLRRFP